MAARESSHLQHVLYMLHNILHKALPQLTTLQPVCSRPTAVNLSDAAQKLSSLAGKTVAQGADGHRVAETIIQACEVMLHDDVAANQVGTEL